MNKQERKGKQEQVEGKVKRVVGAATDNTKMELEGAAKQVKGRVREAIGKKAREIDEQE